MGKYEGYSPIKRVDVSPSTKPSVNKVNEFCNEWSPIMMAKPETSQFELEEGGGKADGNIC